MKILKVLLPIFIGLIILSNISIVSYLFREEYTYSNFDGSFTMQEDGGGASDFKVILTRFERYKSSNANSNKADTTLYRTFSKKPWRFWQWGDYLFCPERFRLPYRDTNNN